MCLMPTAVIGFTRSFSEREFYPEQGYVWGEIFRVLSRANHRGNRRDTLHRTPVKPASYTYCNILSEPEYLFGGPVSGHSYWCLNIFQGRDFRRSTTVSTKNPSHDRLQHDVHA